MVLQNKKHSQQSIAASIAETDVVLGLVESVTGKNAQIEIPKLRTRLNTGDQIFDAGVRLSAFGTGLVKTDATGIISVSTQITIDAAAAAGSIAVDSNSKTTLKQLTVGQLGVDANAGIVLNEFGGDGRVGQIYMDSFGQLQIKNTAGGNDAVVLSGVRVDIFPVMNIKGDLIYEDNILAKFGTGSDYSWVYNSATDEIELIDGATVGANIRIAVDSSGNIRMPSLAGAGSRTVVADANGVLSAP